MGKVTAANSSTGQQSVIRNHVHLSQLPLSEPQSVREQGSDPLHHYLDWLLEHSPRTGFMQETYEPHPELPVYRQLTKLATCIRPGTRQSRYFGQIVAAMYPDMARKVGAYTTDSLGYARLGIDSRAIAQAVDGHFRIELLTNSTDNAPVSHHLWVFDANGKLVMELVPHDNVSFFRLLMEELTGRPLPEDLTDSED